MPVLIRPATITDIPAIQKIARETWPVAFGDILSAGQIAYMLEMMYSMAALTAQIEHKGHVFHLACEDATPIGYVSHECNYQDTNKTKIHKIYLLPHAQGKGGGAALIDAVKQIAMAKKQSALTLNVNKYNNALGFYRRLGFVVAGEEDIDIGNGFLMEDFILDMPLAPLA